MRYSKLREANRCHLAMVALLAERMEIGATEEQLRIQNQADGFHFTCREGSEQSGWCSKYRNFSLSAEEFESALQEAQAFNQELEREFDPA